jgi:uncharacterized protein YjbJ (UPF0337 family)
MVCLLLFSTDEGEVAETIARKRLTMDDRTLGERGAEDSLKGKISHAVGHVKDALGGLTGDKSLQAEGKVDELKGKLQDGLGEAERDLDRGLRNDGL